MKKNTYRITEGDLKCIMESVMKRVLTEGSSETSDLSTWEDFKEMLGADRMLDMIWNYLSADQLRDIMASIRQELDMDGSYEDFDYEDDDDYDDGFYDNDEF